MLMPSGCLQTHHQAPSEQRERRLDAADLGVMAGIDHAADLGFGDAETVVVEDAPMASMFGLARRSIRLPREQEEERKVVRFSRPKGRAGKSRRKR